MTEQDIPAGLRLNTIAGWNQTSTDWRRFLQNSPNGCFVMEHDAKVVGTATTISYENRFAWIGMVLVVSACPGNCGMPRGLLLGDAALRRRLWHIVDSA